MFVELMANFWLFSHTFDKIGRLIKLSEGGSIVGQLHENEYTWEIIEQELIFRSADGKTSNIFSLKEFDGISVEGKFVLWEDSGITSRLTKSEEVVVVEHASAYDLAESTSVLAEDFHVAGAEIFYSNQDDSSNGYRASRIDLIRLKNVHILNMYGVIKKGAFIVRESLRHFPFHLNRQIASISNSQIVIKEYQVSGKVAKGLHAFHGVSGNYYHWMILFVCMIGHYCKGMKNTENLIVILPEYIEDYQKRSAEIISEYYKLPIFQLREDSAIEVDELLFPLEPSSIGITPHPGILETFNIIKGAAQLRDETFSDKIYISRSDTKFRRLENEDRIEKVLRNSGFDVVHLTGKSLDMQVAIFSNASIIVSPHGAGLTNILFCKPGTKVLEFQSPNHVNWCMRNLASIAGLRYGSLMGRMSEEDRYSIEEASLIAALEEIDA